MKYQLRHLTTYLYEKPVTFARCVLRLAPHEGVDQQVADYSLRLTPIPKRIERHIGQFGEPVLSAIIETPHRELKILAKSKVTVTRPPLPRPLGGMPWEAVRDAAFAAASLETSSPAQFLYPTPMTDIDAAITAYVAESFTPGRPIVDAGFEVACRIKADFIYDGSATEVTTLPGEAFRARRGVCQDFAQIMIAGLRGLGLPASYVSGYLRTYPPPGQPRLAGADATHAWVNLWCGPQDGWVGFDPTNALVVAEDHIVLAVGRDYPDIAPIGGIVLGPGKQTIKVGVDVIPMEDAPTKPRARAKAD